MTKIRLETPTVLADGILKTDNPINASLQVVKDQINNESALEISTNETGLKASSTATTQTTAVIQATDTNSGIAIVPNGTGAFTLQVPDGTITAGGGRGDYAIDFQRFRTTTLQGARGSNSGIFAGYNNDVTGLAGVVCGGRNNTVSTSHSGILTGQSNTTSTNTHATVVGGYQNSSTGQYSISGGVGSIASGKGSIAIGTNDPGAGCVASGIGSVAFGGRSAAQGNYSMTVGSTNLANSGVNSLSFGDFQSNTGSYNATFGRFVSNTNNNNLAFGLGTKAAYKGTFSFQSGMPNTNSSNLGIAQAHMLTMQKTADLTTGGTTTLFIDGNIALLNPYNTNTVWNVTVKYTAVVTNITGTATGVSVGDCKNEVLTIGFKKIGGISQNVGAINILSTNEDASMNSAVFGISAGPSQEMKLDFSAPIFIGGGSLTIRVVAKVELTEVAY